MVTPGVRIVQRSICKLFQVLLIVPALACLAGVRFLTLTMVLVNLDC